MVLVMKRVFSGYLFIVKHQNQIDVVGKYYFNGGSSFVLVNSKKLAFWFSQGLVVQSKLVRRLFPLVVWE